VVGNCGSNIEVFIQNASGGLNPGVSYPTANSCSIKIADLNNDGLLDVVGIGKGTNTADIFFQNFSGTLSPPVTYAVVHGPNYDEVDIGDLNNDGLTDIIIMSDRGFGILLQRSGGSFDPAVYYDLGGNETVQGIAIGDVNGDNLQDIVVSYGGDSGIGIFLQNISGPLDPVVKYRSYGGSTVIADVNNDGKKDIIISGGAIGIHLQGPGGMILPVESYPLPGSASSNPQRLSVGDINGDGFNDVVLADYNDGLVVLYNIRGPAIPNIDVFPSSVNFGSVFLGHSGSRDITIYNRGTGGLTISAIGITGPDAAAFSQTNTCSTVGPGSTCTVTVTFDATTEGEKNAILIITSNDPGTPLVEVTFFGYVPGPAIPNISISRSSVDFGSVLLRNTSSPPQYIIIYNTGTGDLIVNSISITGENASEFNQTNNCSTVWPGGYCEINATLTPVSEGTKSATLTISSNDPVNPLVQVTFSAHAGPPLFHPYVSLYTGSLQEAVAIGDVNGDGRNDVVMTTSFYSDPDNDYRIFVFLQDSSGQLQPPIRYPTNSSYSRGPISIDIGDVNHDGRADVVVGNCGSNIEVFIQNASGGLNPGVSYPTVNSCSIKIADLNNDGLLDVVGIGNTNTVDIFLQNSNGTLDQPVTYSVIHEGPDNQEVEVGDVNNDGLMDIIVMSEHGMAHNIGVLLQQNNGTFGEPAYYYLDGNKLTGGVAVGDVNGDNLQDIVVSATWPSSRIGVFLQNSAGALNPATSYQSHLDPEPIVIADMNADGKKDVIVVHHGYERLGIYLQGSDGSLLPEQLYVLPYGYCSNPQGLAVGDVNGDGFNDVVIVNHGYGLVVLYGRKQEPAISVSPVSLNFNPTYLGYTSAQTLTISNEGTKNLNVATIVLSGSNASEFKIDYDNCSERTLLTLDSCTVSVFFAPESPGVKDAVLTVNSNDPGEPNLLVSVSGTAVLGPDIRQPISPIGFGDVNVGRLLDGTTTIFNDGDNTLFVAITRSSGSADFSYIGSWFTIPAGGSQTVTVRFSPSSPGAKEATFIVISNDPDENGAPFTVSGTGVPVPDIRQPISSVEFSGVNVGSLLDRTTAIFNDGTDTLTISKITRDSGSTAFVYIAPATPFTIPAGGSQTITVRFSPASRGAKSATFTVNSNDPDESSVSFTASGTGVTIPDIRQPVVSINFDDVNAGVSIDQTTTLYNDGLGILTINSITRASGSTAFVYIAPATPFTIPAGGSRTITVRFSPTSGGAKSATFNVNSNDPDEGNVLFSVSGTGVVSVQPFPFFDDFSTNKGWIGYEPGGWKRGPASAGSVESGNPDPAADHTQTGDNYLLGYNIGGGYPNNLLEEKAIISPAIDCAGQSAVFLKFWRYLNVQSNFYDHAKIYVSNDGENWTELWENPVFDLTDNQWRQVVFDISSIAANQPTVYINFSMGPTDSSLRFSGWNIDDLEVTSDYSGPMALYVHTDDSHNSNVDEMLIQAGLSIKHFDAIPSNLSDYDLLIVSDEGVCNSTTANSIKAFVQNGAGAIIMNGTPYPLAGNTTDLSSIRDWFGAGSYGNDGGYATVAAPNPFGTALLIDEKVYYSAPNSAAAVYDLAPEANLVSKWSSNGAHSFSYRVGQGRVFYYAGNPGYSEDPNPVIMENSLILFEAGLLWASGCTVPMITTQPQSQTIQSGQKATMSVSASGTPPLSYQWYQGATGNTSTPVGANSNIYTTPALTQTASYWVRVINACGSVDSNTATVTVATAGIAVVSPNGGETWPAGSTQTIRWNYTGNPGLYMKIELFKGGVVNRTIKSFVWKGTGGSGSFNWMVPVNQAPGADYRIRVTSTTYGGCTYTSDSDFTIAAPTITVVSPNEGETWAAGSIQTIRWNYTGNPGPYVKIELLKGGVVTRTIASSGKGSGGSGSCNWTIPANQAPGTDYRIRVTSTINGADTGTSDIDFTIEAPTMTVASPNGGETLTPGTTQTIRWTFTGNPGSYVKIELLKGKVVDRIIKSFAWKGSRGNGSYNWHIPSTQAPGGDYQIRVTSTSNNSYSDTSDSNFTISK
jgi:hypothetical protein